MSRQIFNNPYTNRGTIRSPEDFFGRTEELRNIYTRIQGGQSVSLVGERRIGKSSLLNALEFERDEYEVSEQFCFVPIDNQYIINCTERRFQEYLLSRISEVGEISVGDPSRRSLLKAAEDLRNKERQLVVVLDEFDVLIHNPQIPIEFFSFLRSWAIQSQVTFVVASREGSIDHVAEDDKTGSAFLNIFGTVYVGPMLKDEAEDLVRIPSESRGVEITDEEVEFVLDLAGYFPLFVQIACYHLFNFKLSGQVNLHNLERNFAYEATPYFMGYFLKRLSEAENETLQSLVVGGDVTNSPGLTELIRKGIVLESEFKPRIFSRIFSGLIKPPETSRSAVHAAIGKLLE